MYIVIATSGRTDLLMRTLESVAQCRKPSAFRGLILVENGTPQKTQLDFPSALAPRHVEHLHIPAPGKSNALNVALDQIGSGLVVFFDDDVRVHTDALLLYAEAAQREGRDVFFGGPQDVDYESPPAPWLKPYLPSSARGWGLEGMEQENDQWFIGTNWAAYAASIRQAGGFNERIGPGSPTNSVGQETDMQERLYAKGLRQVFVPGAKVWHYVPKARCAPSWMLHRGYRMGIRIGLKSDAPDDRLFGIPRWWYRALWEHLSKMLKNSIHSDKTVRFESALNLCRHVGILQGYRQSK
jgi:glycosyltransferase involved in cell wall biosynthesis